MMTNAEHLIKNAVTALELHDPYEAYSIFMYNPRNAEMAALAGVSLDAVWEMAQYCYTTLRTEWQGNNQSSFRWIPVTERLPEEDLQNESKAKQIKVLTAYKTGNGCLVTKTQLRRKGRHFWYWGVSESVTHWMPLPYAPKEEQ